MKKYGRQSGVFDLNHGWRFKEEDFSVLPKGRSTRDLVDFAKACGYLGPASASFDDSAWETVDLPHDWVTRHDFDPNQTMDHGYKARGIGWYRKIFNLEKEDEGKQILIEFEGLSSEAQIYANGQLIWRNTSGYVGFATDITDIANFGDVPNFLAVRIDASSWEGWWYEGAGIYRPAWLVKKPPLHIAYLGQWINPIKTGPKSWEVQIETTVENSFAQRKEAKVVSTLLDENNHEIASVKSEGAAEGFSKKVFHQTIQVENPNLWNPWAPCLYHIKSAVIDKNAPCPEQDSEGASDHLVTDFGFRTIRLDPQTGFWINEKNLKLKGFCNHQDHGGLGAAVPYAIKEFRIKKLKELGANAYRCAHNHDPEILDACDRLGMIVMDENRLFSTSHENLERLKRQVKDTRNHPCACLYSIFNEEPLQGVAKGRRMAQRLQAEIKKLDPTRPVLGSMNGGYLEKNGASGVLDAVGFNYFQDMYDEFHKKFPGVPMLGSETSSAFGTRGEYETCSKKNIVSSLDQDCSAWGASGRDTWEKIKDRPFVAGNFAWTGFDYRGEPTPFSWPSVSSFFGVLDSCGFPKASAYVYKALYSEEPTIHIERCSSAPPQKGKTVRIAVMTNCQQADLYLNSVKVASEKIQGRTLVQFEMPDEKGVWKTEGLDEKGNAVCSDILVIPGLAKGLRIEFSKETLEGDGMDAVAVNVYAVDQNGATVPGADNFVRFAVSKGGRIAGVGNGDPNSHEPDFANSRRLFHGAAQAIVLNDGPRDLVFSAFAEGLGKAQGVLRNPKSPAFKKAPSIARTQVEGWKIYRSLFDSMPDPEMKGIFGDMNSFEPVSFEGLPQAKLSGHFLKFALFRNQLEAYCLPGELVFERILGKAWVYLDGALVARKEYPREGRLSVLLPEPLGKKTEPAILTVILQNADRDLHEGGILAPVFLQKSGRQDKS